MKQYEFTVSFTVTGFGTSQDDAMASAFSDCSLCLSDGEIENIEEIGDAE